MLPQGCQIQKFKVLANLNSEVMDDFISFIRFLMFKGELKVLHANAKYDAYKMQKSKLKEMGTY